MLNDLDQIWKKKTFLFKIHVYECKELSMMLKAEHFVKIIEKIFFKHLTSKMPNKIKIWSRLKNDN